MPLEHRFQNHSFPNGYTTHDSILSGVDYEPEVMFIGTHNHGWPWNPADFYYGRGMYMWPVMTNLFLHNANVLTSPRTLNNNQPTLAQIFDICKKGRMVFGDVVKGIADGIPFVVNVATEDVLVNGTFTWKGYADKSLNLMGANGWMTNNVEAIVKYISDTPSIRHVYYTLYPTGWLGGLFAQITAGVRPNVTVGSIFTPSGQGQGRNLAAPLNNRASKLAHHWTSVNTPHSVLPPNPNYTNLDHQWLMLAGVDPHNF